MCFDVLAERTGICVALHAACHFAVVRLVNIVGACVFEAVAGVRVTFAAAFIRADVGFFSWGDKKRIRALQEKNCFVFSFLFFYDLY